jgi:16S rRNA processing protein RimM
MTDPPAKRVLLGRIAAAHGIRGEVLVKSYAAAPQDIAAYGALTNADGTQALVLKVVRVTSKGVICRVAGVTDRNGAEALAGTDLYVDRARLPPPPEGEYYHVDLIGLAALAPDGSHIGTVAAVRNYGGGDLLEIRLSQKPVTELVPLTEAFVPTVDIQSGHVVVSLPIPAPDDD